MEIKYQGKASVYLLKDKMFEEDDDLIRDWVDYAIAYESGPVIFVGTKEADWYRSYSYVEETDRWDFLYMEKIKVTNFKDLVIMEKKVKFEEEHRGNYTELVTYFVGDGHMLGKVWTDESEVEYPVAKIYVTFK